MGAGEGLSTLEDLVTWGVMTPHLPHTGLEPPCECPVWGDSVLSLSLRTKEASFPVAATPEPPCLPLLTCQTTEGWERACYSGRGLVPSLLWLLPAPQHHRLLPRRKTGDAHLPRLPDHCSHSPFPIPGCWHLAWLSSLPSLSFVVSQSETNTGNSLSQHQTPRLLLLISKSQKQKHGSSGSSIGGQGAGGPPPPAAQVYAPQYFTPLRRFCPNRQQRVTKHSPSRKWIKNTL